MKVSVAMTREVVVVAPSVTLSAAARTLERMHVRHLPVVEGGRLVGIISDRDVLASKARGESGISCGEAMSPSPITCLPGASVGRVAELMLTHRIDSIPVVDEDDALVGLVTSSDLLSLLVEREGALALPFDYRLRPAESDDALDAVA
jgi:acetoin utilization protein AcuB